MLKGVYKAYKKDGSLYYRSNINYQNKHISLGSYESEIKAYEAYVEAYAILKLGHGAFVNSFETIHSLPFSKLVILFNFRDNGMYITTPIYLRENYFSYYLDESTELKFDIEDLFYYSSRTIIKRGGHLFVNDYGMQVSVLSRFGIRPYAVCGRDYVFNNGDIYDYRYSNITVNNIYHGVICQSTPAGKCYRAQIHLNGYVKIGVYATAKEAAIAYNKAADIIHSLGNKQNFPTNYIENISPKDYADIYASIKMPDTIISYMPTNKLD